ncbi:4341_t:CDS:2 [Rhizophagus irregularis]|nr:4341_t:CDS:2 [Rhizophagus irregularis]
MSKNTKNIKKIEDGEVVPLSPNTSRTSSSTSSRSNLIQRYLKYPSRNISSNIKQNTINTSSSKIPQISQSIPKIHLPKSVANLPKLSRQPLDETERDLKVENEKLKAHVEELETKLNKIFLELKETQDLNETLIAINEEFRKKNDDLYKKLEIYKNLRKPSIVEKGKSTRKHARSDEYKREYEEKIGFVLIFIGNLDHSLAIQNAKLTRARSYNYTLQHLDVEPPKNTLQ